MKNGIIAFWVVGILLSQNVFAAKKSALSDSASQAQTEESADQIEPKRDLFYIGAGAGLADLSAKEIPSEMSLFDSHFGMSASAGLKLGQNLILGAHYNRSTNSQTFAGSFDGTSENTLNLKIGLTLQTIAGETSVCFKGFRVGALSGALVVTSDVKASVNGTDIQFPGNSVNSETEFVTGPILGYDYKLSPYFSLGAEASLIFVNLFDKQDDFRVLNTAAYLKFWP